MEEGGLVRAVDGSQKENAVGDARLAGQTLQLRPDPFFIVAGDGEHGPGSAAQGRDQPVEPFLPAQAAEEEEERGARESRADRSGEPGRVRP